MSNTDETDKKLMTKYSYIDGSGNQYLIRESEIEYLPMKPELSSSGEYDGGPAWKKAITETEHHHILSLIHQIVNTSSIHLKNRRMGSGTIIIDNNDGKIVIYIAMRSSLKINLENMLNK